MNSHYGFFNNHSNDIMHSTQYSYLQSSTTWGVPGYIKGLGTYMYKDNFRSCISLFSTRSLVKSTWLNSNNVYMGEPK
jgi:hypothetical protein